ncbi:unnamed protein product [Echinostoma caproni]|uniref:tRNA-synt_1c domain-containing protein n=1 Tax=Echinostoma caproni TaxID=27848 RepID=A0A183AVL0_9TREM|nr:unnamed protein product [Echinostoma caproni]
MPVYHMANVVDDHYMSISHVIRGVEWLSSTPKHVLLYEALNWNPPSFVHLPLLLSSTGGKLSKRSPEFALVGHVHSLIRKGYLPSAVLTWLASVGTRSSQHSPDDSHQEYERWNPQLQMPDLVSRFSLDSISRQNVTISTDTLRLCGRAHFDRLAAEALDVCQTCPPSAVLQSPELLTHVRQYLRANLPDYQAPNRPTVDEDIRLANQLCALRGRISCLSDLVDPKQGFAFLWHPIDFDICLEKLKATVFKTAKPTTVTQFLALLAEDLDSISRLTLEGTDSQPETAVAHVIDSRCTELGLKRPIAMHAIRICLTGFEVGLPITDLVNLLTIKLTAERLRIAGKKMCARRDVPGIGG